MNIEKIMEISIEAGKAVDPRKERVKELLKDNKKAYEKSENKKYFNKDSLWNPYLDSNILNGDKKLYVETIFVGIDIEAQELLLVDRLKEKGEKIDLVIAHHPEGRSLLELYKMVKIQEDILMYAGVNVSSAEKMLDESYEKYSRRFGSLNYNRAVDTAKLLEIPFINIHTPADNMVQKYLEDLFEKETPKTLKDIKDVLMTQEEYKLAAKDQNSVEIIAGTPDSRSGKIYVDMTGGVEASDAVYEKMEAAGVGTIVGMHMSEAHLKKAKEHNLNVVMAGHMASDSLGMNLILDEIEKEREFKKIIEGAGFKRVSRL